MTIAISKALRLLRVYSNLNQKQLAPRLNISVSYLSELETGKKAPNLEYLGNYAKAFGIPLSSLIYLAEGISETPRELISLKVLSLLEAHHLNNLDEFDWSNLPF